MFLSLCLMGIGMAFEQNNPAFNRTTETYKPGSTFFGDDLVRAFCTCSHAAVSSLKRPSYCDAIVYAPPWCRFSTDSLGQQWPPAWTRPSYGKVKFTRRCSWTTAREAPMNSFSLPRGVGTSGPLSLPINKMHLLNLSIVILCFSDFLD